MKTKQTRKYKEIRLFKSDFLESLSHVHPITPLLIWAPVSLYFLYDGITTFNLGFTQIALTFIAAFFVWTLSEYLLHRYLFHFPAKSNFGKRFVFLFHGLHHDEPNDPTRLVMPPVPAFLFISLFYFLFKAIIPMTYLHVFMGFFLIGYLCYDYIHYATHHFPMKSKVGKFLKRHHISHHNRFHDAKYGVSTPLWDYILGTYSSKK